MTKIIAITGGKGGTGKTTVAVSLAKELSRNNKVLLVDADSECPNDHIVLNYTLKKIKNVKQRIPVLNDKCIKCGICSKYCENKAILYIKNQKPIFFYDLCNGCGACKLTCPYDAIDWNYKVIGYIKESKESYNKNKNENNNLKLITGELKINQQETEPIIDELNKIINLEKDNYDYVIIDTGAGTHCNVITALDLADFVITVTEPTPLALHDLELILQLKDKLNKKFYIIINKANFDKNNKIKSKIYQLEKKYNSKVIFEINYNKKIFNDYANSKLNINMNELIDTIVKD